MNLTFSDTGNNSFSANNNRLLFPSIFSKFETEKNFSRDSLCIKLAKNKIFLPNYKNIKQEMSKVKKQIRNLFDIKNSIFKEMITKKNSTTYQNFIRGFGKYFFGPFGLITQKNKFLKDYYLQNSVLNAKIYAGRLDYYDYINKYNRFNQRQNNAKKHILSISKNYAVVGDKNDMFIMKALTSSRLYNRRKDFVSLNRQRYRNSISEIKEILPNNNNKKVKFINKTFNDKIKKYKNKNQSNSKGKIIKPLYLKTYSNFYNNKKRNIFNNYKKAVANIKNKYNKMIYSPSNTEKTRTNSNVNIKIKNKNNNNRNSSNFFLTQGSFSSNKLLKNKITFNRITKLKNYKTTLN